ncbi:hypothetical protein N7488_012311 [Penicillium malachiteum]|nr:hypothetical protein N7488_012311 [Penicillium malachiteum]
MPTSQWRPGKRIAIVGGGPGSISAALAFIQRGFDVRVFERQPEYTAIGGAVLLATPILAILRSYGMDEKSFGSHTNASSCLSMLSASEGWHYGVLRSSIFKKMLELLPENVIYAGHEFISYTEHEDRIELLFKNGYRETADILIGADEIRSTVSRQAFGDPRLFHTGIRLWLAWCDQIPDIPPNYGFISHKWQYQASFFPMLHEGKPGFEWWVVEPSWEGKPIPQDPKAYLADILKDWAQPLPRFLDVKDFNTQVYCWEIYNRPSLKKWSTGRVVCLGDAVHPVSPYAAYGMGMAIEDGYFLARALDGVDLQDKQAINAGFEIFEKERVSYVNHNVEFARKIGWMFHSVPRPLAWLRDVISDYTPVLSNVLKNGHLKQSEEQTLNLSELHVV